jgi:hypothetical protein
MSSFEQSKSSDKSTVSLYISLDIPKPFQADDAILVIYEVPLSDQETANWYGIYNLVGRHHG